MNASRDDHLRRLAGIFDSPQFTQVQEELRKENGDCWDCACEHREEFLLLGGVRKIIVTCGHLAEASNGRPIPVMRSLPFRCPNWKKKRKLTVIEGG